VSVNPRRGWACAAPGGFAWGALVVVPVMAEAAFVPVLLVVREERPMPWRGGLEEPAIPAGGVGMEPRPVAAESGLYYGLIRHESPVGRGPPWVVSPEQQVA
jgi:hypothetical protein